MDLGQIGDDGRASLRAAWREECWLPAGLVVAVVAYALWVGLTGAALSFVVEATVATVTFSQWTTLSTFAVVVAAALWVFGPAALATVLVVDRLTNVNDNLRVGYRLRHPVLLLGPPTLVLAVGYVSLVGTARAGPAVSTVLVLGAVWLVVRTTAYAYRVFSLSLPVAAWFLLFATGVTVASAALVGAGLLVGQGALLNELLSGIATRLGVPAMATFHTGSHAIGGVDVPLPVAAVIAVPVVGTAVYLAVQVAWSVLNRVREPTVRRPQLRTGQRYPRYVRPTTTPSSDGIRADGRSGRSSNSTSSADRTETGAGSGPAAAGDAGDEPTDPSAESVDDGTHTRVFKPPDDADLEDVDGLPHDSPDGDAIGRETTIVAESTGGYCPDCGEPVEDASSSCPSCGASLDRD